MDISGIKDLISKISFNDAESGAFNDIQKVLKERTKELLNEKWEAVYKQRSGEAFLSLEQFVSELYNTKHCWSSETDEPKRFSSERERKGIYEYVFGDFQYHDITNILSYAIRYGYQITEKVQDMVCSCCLCHSCSYCGYEDHPNCKENRKNYKLYHCYTYECD